MGRGIQTRKRQVVQSSTGCDEMPLSGERHCLIKECELCGDGRKVGDEACDDGNIKDGVCRPLELMAKEW